MSAHSGLGPLTTVGDARLLAGITAAMPTLHYADHLAVHGPLPAAVSRSAFHRVIAESGLRGRGGAGFPLAKKVESLAGRRKPVVVVNASEGEPLSRKDAVLLARVPHLVLDGAQAAAQAIHADEVIVYLHEGRAEAEASLARALSERRDRVPTRVVPGPARYVAGEASAAVAFLSGGEALPTRKPPQPTEKGVRGRPTLISNAETFGHVALIVRYGAPWFKSVGAPSDPGTVLLTVSDGTTHVVVEAPTDAYLETAIERVGGSLDRCSALLLGGYAGTWVEADAAVGLPLDRDALDRLGLSLGVGQVALLPTDACYLRETARVTHWLAGETAGQCGPCVHGLPDIASLLHRVAVSASEPADTATLQRWSGLVETRGACAHPGGVARLVRSALALSPDHLKHHQRGLCRSTRAALPIPRAVVGVA